jgi:hypothetical protein
MRHLKIFEDYEKLTNWTKDLFDLYKGWLLLLTMWPYDSDKPKISGSLFLRMMNMTQRRDFMSTLKESH